MRYTTIIDITENAEVYRNKNARLLYLHLALKSGYHDQDRDLIGISLRTLANQAGLTLSATRHALKVLQKAELAAKEGEKLRIKKFLVETPPSPRPRQNQAKSVAAVSDLADRYQQEIEQRRQQLITAVRNCTREELIAWRQELTEHRSKVHHGCRLEPTQKSINWLTSIIERT